MDRSICIILILITVAANRSQADIVVLSDGRELEGEILSDDGLDLVLKGRFGKTTLSRRDIKTVVKKESPAEDFRKKIEALRQSVDKNDAEAWSALGVRARNAGASDEMKAAFTRALELDSNDSTARKELGFVRQGADWIKAGVATPREPGGAGALPLRNEAAPLDRDKLAAAAGVDKLSSGAEQPTACPRCAGTGIGIYLECLQCKRSPKPGYVNIGDRLQECPRCVGKAKVIGARCDLCKHTGKVVLSQLSPADGGTKKPPVGYQWCGTCTGSGIDGWLDCNQCKRSKWPGYNFLGDTLAICNRCNGRGKMPSMPCLACAGKCIVPAK